MCVGTGGDLNAMILLQFCTGILSQEACNNVVALAGIKLTVVVQTISKASDALGHKSVLTSCRSLAFSRHIACDDDINSSIRHELHYD